MKIILLSLFLLVLSGCNQKISKEDLEKVISDNPQMISEVIEKNPVLFIQTFQKAARAAQAELGQQQQEPNEEQELEASFANRLTPSIRPDELIVGDKNAPITIVEYSDFECGFCSRGYNTIKAVMQQHQGKVRFIYKHLPLSFHPQALISAQYYEAIRLQSEKKAVAFHDYIFEHQPELRNGKAFLDQAASRLSVNMKKLNSDIHSDTVRVRIEADVEEARKFGMDGTPGFVINGVAVRGAYPIEYFNMIISRLNTQQ